MKMRAAEEPEANHHGTAAPALFNKDISALHACVIGLLVSIVICFPWIRDTARDWNSTAAPSWEGVFADSPLARTSQVCDIDTFLIHQGVIEAPGFTDTFRWWHGIWAGKVVFYRPVTSELFWLEWKAFGVHETRYAVFAILLHLAAVWQFCRLAHALFKRVGSIPPGYSALLACLIFSAGCWVLPVRDDTMRQVYGAWKNMPESLSTVFWCLSLRAVLAAQPLADGRNFIIRNLVPALWYLAVCGTKEAGMLLPVAAFVLEVGEIRRGGQAAKMAYCRLSALVAAFAIYMIVRYYSLHTAVGFRYGSNGTWLSRMADILIGMPATAVRTGRWAQIIAAGVLVLLAVLTVPWDGNGKWIARKGLIGAGVAGAAGFTASLLINLEAPILVRPVWLIIQIWDLGPPGSYVGLALFVLGTGYCIRFLPWMALFGVAWLAACAALLAFTPTSNHRLYLTDGGWAVILSAGLIQWGVIATSGCRLWTRRSGSRL